jgi:hypothetical protein
MLRSACRNLSPGWRLEVFVHGYQIPEERQHWLEAGLTGLPVLVRWQSPDLSAVEGYWPGLRGGGDVACYYRLFLGQTLPEAAERALFLDADLLVEGDLAKLWNIPFEGHVIQAVPDAYAHSLHTPRLSLIRFPEGIGFSRETPYFNAGVQLIDLRLWREERIGQRAGEFLWKYGQQLRGRDQDALNCALAGRWKRLPPTWNFQELPGHAASWKDGGASPAEVREALRRPAIIHFIGWKPWSGGRRPLRQELWWKEARQAGIAPVKRPARIAIWEALAWRPYMLVRRALRR